MVHPGTHIDRRGMTESTALAWTNRHCDDSVNPKKSRRVGSVAGDAVRRGESRVCVLPRKS